MARGNSHRCKDSKALLQGDTMSQSQNSGSGTPAISFTDRTLQVCPFHEYRRLHRESSVFLDPVTGFYEVLGHDDLAAIVMNPAVYSSRHPVYEDRTVTSPVEEVRRIFEEDGTKRMPTLINAAGSANPVF
jgi:hypothetical protein